MPVYDHFCVTNEAISGLSIVIVQTLDTDFFHVQDLRLNINIMRNSFKQNSTKLVHFQQYTAIQFEQFLADATASFSKNCTFNFPHIFHENPTIVCQGWI